MRLRRLVLYSAFRAMAFVIGTIIGIAVAFVVLAIVLDTSQLRLRIGSRRQESNDRGQRVADRLAEEIDSIRNAAGGEDDPSAPWVKRRSQPDADTPLHRALDENGEARREHWDPYAQNQSRVYRVQAARRRARSGTVNLYDLLGVPVNASEAEIVRAYRYQVARIHPDKFQGDPRRQALAQEKLKELNHAMQVLRDPARRARHDAALQI